MSLEERIATCGVRSIDHDFLAIDQLRRFRWMYNLARCSAVWCSISLGVAIYSHSWAFDASHSSWRLRYNRLARRYRACCICSCTSVLLSFLVVAMSMYEGGRSTSRAEHNDLLGWEYLVLRSRYERARASNSSALEIDNFFDKIENRRVL